MCDITLAPAAQKALDMHTKTGSAAMAERGIQVRATAMSGHQVDLLLGAEEPIALLRQKVSEALGIRKWQLRLIHGAMVLNDGGLIKELVAETETNETVEVMALAVEAIEVKERSKELFSIFKRRIRTQHFHIDAINRINRHEEAILNGEVAFDYLGDNMLELLLNNWSSGAIERPMSLLLAGGACVNTPSNDGYTPLLTACSRGLGEEANLLLEHGASPRQHLPNGNDALISALKFFQACSEVNARSRQEDLHLGWTCCILRAAHIRSATGLLPLEEARLKLSQAAIELALLAPAAVSLCQKRILEKSAVDPAVAEAFGEDLWAGWPQAFFTFSLQIPKVVHDWDKDFSVARQRILAYKLGNCEKVPVDNQRRAFRPRYFDEYSVYSDVCTCPFCCPSLYNSLETDSFVTSYQLRKDQNRKWETSKANARRTRRAPFASSSGRVSRSSRMARKLPPSYRGFQVGNVLQGQQKSHSKQSKLQVLKHELAFDCYGLDMP